MALHLIDYALSLHLRLWGGAEVILEVAGMVEEEEVLKILGEGGAVMILEAGGVMIETFAVAAEDLEVVMDVVAKRVEGEWAEVMSFNSMINIKVGEISVGAVEEALEGAETHKVADLEVETSRITNARDLTSNNLCKKFTITMEGMIILVGDFEEAGAEAEVQEGSIPMIQTSIVTTSLKLPQRKQQQYLNRLLLQIRSDTVVEEGAEGAAVDAEGVKREPEEMKWPKWWPPKLGNDLGRWMKGFRHLDD
jgi:hypothetical protein